MSEDLIPRCYTVDDVKSWIGKKGFVTRQSHNNYESMKILNAIQFHYIDVKMMNRKGK
jgi:hypothetical protein